MAPPATKDETSDRKTRSSTEDLGAPPSPKRRKVDVYLNDYIRGQHAAELLLELENSFQGTKEEFGNNRHMLGLIVQATKVSIK